MGKKCIIPQVLANGDRVISGLSKSQESCVYPKSRRLYEYNNMAITGAEFYLRKHKVPQEFFSLFVKYWAEQVPHFDE